VSCQLSGKRLHGGTRAGGNIPAQVTFLICEVSEEVSMLKWALVFLVLGLVAGVLGFTAIAGASIAIAKFLFFIFIAVFVVLLILGMTAVRRITGR